MPENTNAVRDSDRNYGHNTSPKTVLVLPPYSEFALHPAHGAFLRDKHGGLVWPQDSPLVSFCTGAAMWEEFSYTEEARKCGVQMFSRRQSVLWRDAAFGRIPLAEIEFRKNEEMKS